MTHLPDLRWLCGTLTTAYIGFWVGAMVSRLGEPTTPFVLFLGAIVVAALWLLYGWNKGRADALALPPDYRASEDDGAKAGQ